MNTDGGGGVGENISVSESTSTGDENSSDNELPLKSRRKTRAQRKAQERREAYERRRSLWIRKYGSVEALQETFGRGSVSNFWGGDLSPEQTRRLYNTLLPRSLLGLHEMGLMKPDELAPLAYKARIAAKEYARSRCNLSGRTMTAVFDQYRNLKRYGRFTNATNLSWEEIWDKYEAQIVEEDKYEQQIVEQLCTEELENDKLGKPKKREKKQDANTTTSNEDLTMRIYLRILQRSCTTNQGFDSLFLKENTNENEDNNMDFDEIASKLENDVRSILLEPKDSKQIFKKEEEVQKNALKLKRKQKKKDEKEEEKQLKQEKKEAKKIEKMRRKNDSSKSAVELMSNEIYNIDSDDNNYIKSAINQQQSTGGTNQARSQRWQILRILAGTRKKFRTLF